jgi:glycosyltransferase involved in cell wall biosynthesis
MIDEVITVERTEAPVDAAGARPAQRQGAQDQRRHPRLQRRTGDRPRGRRGGGVLQRGGYAHEILVVDDGSQDGTAEAARRAGARVLQQPYNIGNGAAVKLGIRRASGDVIVLMDGDGQHQAEDIPRFLAELEQHDLVVGARGKTSSRALHRIAANRLYSILASYVVGYRVEDLTSGFRAIDAHIAKQIVYLLPNGFSYPSTMTIALFRSGYAVKYIPIRAAARVGRSKIKLLRDGLGFLLILARIGTFFAPMRLYLPAGRGYVPAWLPLAIYRLVLNRPWTLPIVISVLIGLLILVFGLISEQIALLRLGRSEHSAD